MASELTRLRRELEKVIAGMTETAMARAPAGKWSSSQILEHLFLTYKNTNRGVEKCLEKGDPLATEGTLKQRLGAFLVVTVGYMPGGAESPERAVPQGIPPGEVRSKIFAEIQMMEAGLETCQRRFGTKTKIMDHPFLGPLTADQWRKFHWVHGRHHARQIRERGRL